LDQASWHSSLKNRNKKTDVVTFNRTWTITSARVTLRSKAPCNNSAIICNRKAVP
jgi:hypothetical protein